MTTATTTDPKAGQAPTEPAKGTSDPKTAAPAAPAAAAPQAPAASAGGTLLSASGEPAKPEAKPDPAKPEAKPAGVAKLALKLAEETLIGAKELEGFEAQARELGLNSDQAQKLLAREEANRREYVDGEIQKFRDVQAGWRKEIEAHPTLGGAKLKESDEHATRFIEKYGPPGFLQELKDSGYAGHPKLFELLANAGRAMGEDKLPATPASKPPEERPRTLEDNYKQ